MNSLGKAIYRYYNKPSYNISSYPKSVETLRLGSPNKSKTDSVVPAASSSSPPLEPEARHQQQEDANIIDPNRGVDQSIHLPPSPAQPLLLLVSSQEPTNANQTIANSDSPEPKALQEDPKVNNDDDILEKEYSTTKKPKKSKDTRLVAITQENVGAGQSGSPELGTKSDTTASSLIEADREDDQIPVVTLPVTPQVMDDVTSSPTSDTRLQGTKRSYSKVASSTM
eukprot:scaffold6528_cov114-Cylindrotheca_fusiformis.AAC.9